MAKLDPRIAFSPDAKLALIGILKKAVEGIRADIITEPAEVGIVASHLKELCCYLDDNWCTPDGFNGGFDGDFTSQDLCKFLQSSNDVDWHDMFAEHLKHDGWPKPATTEAA